MKLVRINEGVEYIRTKAQVNGFKVDCKSHKLVYLTGKDGKQYKLEDPHDMDASRLYELSDTGEWTKVAGPYNYEILEYLGMENDGLSRKYLVPHGRWDELLRRTH